MKKTLIGGLSFLALALGAVVGAVGARTAVEAKAAATTVYVDWEITASKPGDNAWYAMYYFKSANDSDNGWVKMAGNEGYVFEFLVPDGYDRIIFTRMDGSKETLDWGSKWDQTQDLTVPTDDNILYTISEKQTVDPWKYLGTWGAHEAGSSSSSAAVADGTYLVGTHNDWTLNAESASGETTGTNKGEWRNVDFATNVEFKVVLVDGGVETWLGYDDIEAGCSGLGRFVKGTGEGHNNNIIVTAGSTFDIYLNASDKLWIVDRNPEFIYVASGTDLASVKLYTWTKEAEVVTEENAEFPGVAIADIPGTTCTVRTNFNNQGGIYEVPVSQLYENVLIVYNDGSKARQTADMEVAKDMFIGVPSVEAWEAAEDPKENTKGSAALAAQAKLVKFIEDKIEGAQDGSVCNVSFENAKIIHDDYAALGENHAVIDAATYNAWDGNIDDIAEIKSAGTRKNVTYADLMVQIESIYDAGAGGAWNVSNVVNDNAVVITIAVVGIAAAVIAITVLASRRRRVTK